ncbi:hypothetical protein [Lentzea sp.]|uniref:hypothetical protein n=1 Tax=Lentzea sp. TaxID=56099 RepID=UPI002C533788|nr:hypothetical protein [Lentzea sp.]HUQ55144.1 hypothetical protein [Lentzea sp.]
MIDRQALAKLVASDIPAGSFTMMRGGHLDVCVLGIELADLPALLPVPLVEEPS